MLDFLKQLVDQIAIRCRVPCLYLSFERSKAELRLQTLSRLSEAPATHIRDGRYDKDSAEWQSIIPHRRTGSGMAAADLHRGSDAGTRGNQHPRAQARAHGLGGGRDVHDRRR